MMTNKKLLFILLALTLAAAGCIKEASRSGTFAGDTKPLGDGAIHTWVTLDENGKPASIGITFSEAALTGLPENNSEYTLEFPKEALSSPFNHMGIDWNPRGHEPPGIYDKPHFDFHFYMISPQERNVITATGDDIARVEKRPEQEFIPAGYIPIPGGVPKMGAHWFDPASPEFNNVSFSRTFIYGFYDGRMIFMEPMVTVAFFETKPNITEALKQPERYLVSGYYPARYSVKYNAANKEYTVSLDGMTLRQ